MTLYGWDASHYDGLLSTAILARARAEGIAFFTHKIGEGLLDTEGTLDDTALAAARDVGMPFIGGYLVPRTNATVATQVDRWLALADGGEPWWRTFPGWFWQIDLERWSYDNVPASVGIACAQEIRRRTGRWTILYASHGQYGDELAAWDGPLWNADYTSRPVGGIAAMYPGDDWQPLHGTWRGGWAPYSGKTPAILQYTSSATIAGLTTCDANAYPGTVDQLRALITGTNQIATKGPSMIQVKQSGGPTIVLTDWATWCDRTLTYDQLEAMRTAGMVRVDVSGPALQRILALPQPDKMTTTQAAGAPTDAQVDAAVLKALSDPTVIASLGAAVASHIRVS